MDRSKAGQFSSRVANGFGCFAILINLPNPKLSLFFFAFLPQFVMADEASPLSRMLEFSLVFMALTVVIFAAYGMFASPRSWDRVVAADKLINDNKNAVADSRNAAAKAGKEQKCPVLTGRYIYRMIASYIGAIYACCFSLPPSGPPPRF